MTTNATNEKQLSSHSAPLNNATNSAPSLPRFDTVASEIAVSPVSSNFKLTDQTNLLPLRSILAVFAGLAICEVVVIIDSVIVATALPSISKAFNAGSIVSWVPSGYFLASTCFQPIYGRLSDIFGRKGTICFALVTYMTGSLAAGFSTSIMQLIVFRAIAGAGGGAIIPLSQIIMSDIVSLRERYVWNIRSPLPASLSRFYSEGNIRASLAVSLLSDTS